MSDIANVALASVGAVNLNGDGDIDYITASDAVYFINTNRPTRNLAARDELLQSKINEVVSSVNAARGSETDLAARLAVSIEADGSLKASALPDVSSLSSEITAARGGEASLNDRIQSVDVKADDAVATAQAAVKTHEANFEARAEVIRKVTPSGFSDLGISFFPSQSDKVSDAPGLNAWFTTPNTLLMGHSNNGKFGKFVINGYTVKVSPFGSLGDPYGTIDLPAPPTSGTRQDLVFIEAWKEEVDKDTGIFFPYGNTQYASSSDLKEGFGPTDNVAFYLPGGFTGSAYYSDASGVYAVPANGGEATTEEFADFLNNPDHNIGVLENGNYFQIRYRIRVEADIAPSISTTDFFSEDVTLNSVIKPQGQLASAPARGDVHGVTGCFAQQGGVVGYRQLDESTGIYIGLTTGALTAGEFPIPGLSLDGFTYAIPVCAVHRRNTGVYGLDNLNGTAFKTSDAAFVEGAVAEIGWTNWSSLVANPGAPLYDDNDNGYTYVGSGTDIAFLRITSINGAEPTTGSLWLDSAKTTRWVDVSGTPTYHSSSSHAGSSQAMYHGGRPDGLYSDIIDRRDVLDLRHKVSLKGDFDEDALYQETFDLIMKGEYRQEWEQLTAFDNDGNGLSLVDTGIYGNVLMESLGLGATVPDAGVNTNITRKENCNNGIPVGFNGSRSLFSDKETTEDFVVYVEDQADGIASKTHGSEDGGMISYNSSTHAIEVDLTQHSSYVADISKDPTLLSGHTPEVKWGNGAKVAGVWTKSNDYNWSFEIKEYGTVHIAWNVGQIMYAGSVYTDPNGKRWIVANYTSGMDAPFLPDWENGNDGSVIPQTGNMTYVSGLGPQDPIAINSSRYADLALDGTVFALGYSPSHDTDPNEAIFAKFRIGYKAGSSCLPELPYGAEGTQFKGGSLFLNGSEIEGPYVPQSSSGDASTKTIELGALKNTVDVSHRIMLAVSANEFLSVTPDNGSWIQATSVEDAEVGLGTAFTNPIAATPPTDIAFQYVLDMVKVGSEYFALVVADDTSTGALYEKCFFVSSTDLNSWTVRNGGSPIHTAPYHISDGKFLHNGSNFELLIGVHTGDRVSHYHMTAGADTSATNVTAIVGNVANFGNASSQVSNCGAFWKDGAVYKMLYRALYTGSRQILMSTDAVHWFYGDKEVIGDNADIYSSFVTDSYLGFYVGTSRYIVPMASAYSGTGAHTNASPQVNLGLKSTDTVVLHYDRKAKQPQVKAMTVDIEPKAILSAANDTGISRFPWPINLGHPDVVGMFYNRVDLDPSIARMGYETYGAWHHVPVEIITSFSGKILKDISLTTVNYSSILTTFLTGIAGIESKYPRMSTFYGNSANDYNAEILVFSLMRNEGHIMMSVSTEATWAADRRYSYMLGNTVAPFNMIGRPLVK